MPLEVQVGIEAVLLLDYTQLIVVQVLTELTGSPNHTDALLLKNLQPLGSLLADAGLELERFRISSESHVADFGLHVLMYRNRGPQKVSF